MAQSKATRPVNTAVAGTRSKEQDKIVQAMERASRDARKKLAAEGLKLPTQDWKGSAVRNPAV